MGKTLTIQPVTRIEGHAKISIHLDDAGNVEDARVNVIAYAVYARGHITWLQQRQPMLSLVSNHLLPVKNCAVCATASPIWKSTYFISIYWQDQTL